MTTGVGEVVFVARDEYLAKVAEYKADGFEMCIDVTAVDYLTHPGRALPEGVEPERFEVVVNLISMADPRRVRLRVQVPGDEPHMPSLYDIYPGADAMEREVYDLMGIVFDGHPDLTRILMPEEWEGHPLRKDYENVRVPVQFKAPREFEMSTVEHVRGRAGDGGAGRDGRSRAPDREGLSAPARRPDARPGGRDHRVRRGRDDDYQHGAAAPQHPRRAAPDARARRRDRRCAPSR